MSEKYIQLQLELELPTYQYPPEEESPKIEYDEDKFLVDFTIQL